MPNPIAFKTRAADDRFEVYNTLNGRTATTALAECTAQAIASAYSQPVAEVHGRVVTRGELVEAFQLVEPAGNWKNPIDHLVSECDAAALLGASSGTDGLERVRQAVAFLTGSEARYTESPTAGVWRLKAAGYFAACGA